MASEQLLADVKRTVEQLAELEWLKLPQLHPAGGVEMNIRPRQAMTSQTWADWGVRLEQAGYRAVI